MPAAKRTKTGTEKQVPSPTTKREKALSSGKWSVLFIVPGVTNRRLNVMTREPGQESKDPKLHAEIRKVLGEEFKKDPETVILVSVRPLHKEGDEWKRTEAPRKRTEFPAPAALRAAQKKQLVQIADLYKLDVDTTQGREALAEDMIYTIAEITEKGTGSSES